MQRSPKSGVALVPLALAGLLGACSGSPEAACTSCSRPPLGLVVSGPVAPAARAPADPAASVSADSVVWVSLRPGSVPHGSRARVGRAGANVDLTVYLVGGGFDPVPVTATIGDTIVALVADSLGAAQVVSAAVPDAQAPSVVRIEPPSAGQGMPRNSRVAVLFSEPIAPASVSPASVELVTGSGVVAGDASVLAGSGTEVVFAPAAELDAGAGYTLGVGRTVTSVKGVPLADDLVERLETGTTEEGPVASVRVLPGDMTIDMLRGSRLQMRAVALDAHGIELVGRPITWTSSNSASATVTETGTVTANAMGIARIDATVDGVVGRGAVTRVCVARGTAPVIDTLCVIPIVPVLRP